MTLRPDNILDQIAARPELDGPRRYVVAFSGGMDSTVLLDLMCRALPRVEGSSLVAAHVDHRLHADSQQWSKHCQHIGNTFGVNCSVTQVSVDARPGNSVEAAARDARYACLAGQLSSGDVLVTAHHRDDQLETVLLQLLRGAGSAGLAGMPQLRLFAKGFHWRPLLALAQEELGDYARHHRLDWIDDPGNTDDRYDRNYLRNTVLPMINRRWPGAAVAVSRSARHSAVAARIVQQSGSQDALAAAAGDTLDVKLLAAMPDDRVANALRAWIDESQLPPPDSAHLDEVMKLMRAAADKAGCVGWSGCEIRRYRHRLYAMTPLHSLPENFTATLTPGTTVDLPGGLGQLVCELADGGLDEKRCRTLSVQFRAGGEKIRPRGGDQRRQLRNLFQESGVVPWMRPRVPLLYAGDQLAAVADLWHEKALLASGPGVCVRWDRHPPLY